MKQIFDNSTSKIIIIDYVKNKKYWLFYEAKKTFL